MDVMSRMAKEAELACWLEGQIANKIGNYYTRFGAVELKWSEDMEDDDDLLVVDREGNEYVLGLEVFLTERPKK